jgi:hypothetical protein
MPEIEQTKETFLNSLSDCLDVFRFCMHPRGKHTEAGVEAAFLQMQRAWEAFLEEILLGYLLGETPVSGQPIITYFTVANKDIGRRLLYQERAYCDWINEEAVRNRFALFFPTPNRVDDALRLIIGELREIAKIRNVIPHSSILANDKFAGMWQAKIGGKPKITRAAHFLLLEDRENQPSTYFETYETALEVAATKITG